jgi:hypothetical protein
MLAFEERSLSGLTHSVLESTRLDFLSLKHVPVLYPASRNI